jgi:hypothetical protein
MMLRTTTDNEYINTDQMRELRVLSRPEHQGILEVECTFNDGSTKNHSVSKMEWSEFRRAVDQHRRGTLIKADPGYWLLRYRAKTDEVDRWPVLAWQFYQEDGFCFAETTGLSRQEGTVLFPDGRLAELNAPGVWANENQWLLSMRERAKEGDCDGRE